MYSIHFVCTFVVSNVTRMQDECLATFPFLYGKAQRLDFGLEMEAESICLNT